MKLTDTKSFATNLVEILKEIIKKIEIKTRELPLATHIWDEASQQVMELIGCTIFNVRF